MHRSSDDGALDSGRETGVLLALLALAPGVKVADICAGGRSGTGTSEAQRLHRIEESVVRDEVARAGFKLAGESAFLRNPADARDWNDAPAAPADKRGTSDRFALRFTKP